MMWNGGTVHVTVMSRFESCRLVSILILFQCIYFLGNVIYLPVMR